MHDDELKALWQEQQIKPVRPLPDEFQLAEMKKKMSGLNRTLFWRDCRENIAAIFVMVVFTFYFFKFPMPMARAGAAITVLFGVLVIIYPIWRKRHLVKPSADAPMMEVIEAELVKVKVEIELLRSILWWYILPCTVGVLVFYAGVSKSIEDTILYALGVMVVDVFIYWLNQRAVDEQLLPLKRELEASLSLEEPISVAEPQKKNGMTKMMLFGIVLMLLGAIAFVRGRETKTVTIDYDDPASKKLEAIRVKHNVPALAVAAVLEGKIVATNAVGFRKFGGPERVMVNDKFHLGSITKSMTATVAAMLVEQGKISWNTTIGESFPEFKNEIHPDYWNVTLEQLLSHRGGAPGNVPKALWMKTFTSRTGTPSEQPLKFIKAILHEAPEAKPGTKQIYSNQGYAIAGVMMERAAKENWEDLMRTMLFEPLGMTTAGFGAPATEGKVDQPWGHLAGVIGGLQPIPQGIQADNPPAIGPAGTVHCSIEDLAKYAAFHLAGDRGDGKWLKAETFKKLHTAIEDNDNYAMGWVILKRGWARDRALWHNGSNTMFYGVVWIAPNRNFVVVAATNAAGKEAEMACDDAATEMIFKFLPER